MVANAKKEAEGLTDSKLLENLKEIRNPQYIKAYQAEAARRGLSVPATKEPTAKAPTPKAPAAKAPTKEQKAPRPLEERTFFIKMVANAKKEAEGLTDSKLLENLKEIRNPQYIKAYRAEAARRGLSVPATKEPTAKAPTPKASTPKAPAAKPAAKAPAAKPEGVRAKREKMDLDEFKKDIKKEKTEELADILFARGHGAKAVEEARVNKGHRAALGKDKVDEIEKEVRRRRGLPSQGLESEITAGKSGAPAAKPAAKAPAAKPAAPKAPTAKAPTAKPEAKVKAAQGNIDSFKKKLERQPDFILSALAKNKPQLGSERIKAVEDEMKQRREAAAPKTPTAKPAPKAPTPEKAPTRANPSKETFLEPKKVEGYDFSAEARKPGWAQVGSAQLGAQAEDVRLNRDISQPAALKNGKIGQYEAAALEKLRNVSNVPNLYGIQYDSKGSAQPIGPEFGNFLGPHINVRPGKLAMELKPGKPGSYYVRDARPAAVKDLFIDDLLKARKAIHMRGVAHNDMHMGNVLYDQSNKKLNVIDFGLAQIGPKAALVEALGGWNGGDYQAASKFYKGNGPGVKRYMDNVNNVESKLKKMGIDPEKIPEIRSPMAAIEKYFGKLTDSQAQGLIAEIYDGI
jgi:histone H1/5